MKKNTFVSKFITSLFFITFWIALLNILSIEAATSQIYKTDNIPFEDISSGSLYFKGDKGYYPALTQNSNYQVSVNGLLAKVKFAQTFKNSSDDYLEAVYVFPLIDDASVSSMVMEIGERRIIGQIKEKQQAQKLYRKAKIKGKKASLASQERPNLFTTKVANIAPGESIKISLTYLQSVKLSDETFSLRIPLTITPRFIPLPQRVEYKNEISSDIDNHPKVVEIKGNGWAVNNSRVIDASKITPFQVHSTISTNRESKPQHQLVSLSVILNGGLPISHVDSINHQISKEEVNNKVSISLADQESPLDHDFVLKWKLAQGSTPKAAFFEQTNIESKNSNYQYGLLMVMPPKESNEKTISKEVIYIIDTSGSMGGVALRQAKQSLVTALELLSPSDTFNIISFDDNTESLFNQVEHASVKKVRLAKRWVSSLSAGGGTNMYPAIEQALHVIEEENLYRQVIFITDGSVGNEDELFSLIDRKLANTRLHTIGIGSAPNGYFMTQAAKVGRGTYRYISNINEVSEQMTNLFSQISKPLMKNINLTWPMEQVEMFPHQIPDLYSGQPLLISARWRKEDHLNKNIKIVGQLASKTWQQKILINSEPHNKVNSKATLQIDNNGVAQWWVKEKIDHLLLKQRRSTQQVSLNIKKEITELALKHQLISPYTSFIAIEEDIARNQSTPLKTKGVKNLMPKGTTQSIPIANTALGLIGYFQLSLLLLTIAMIIKRVNGRCLTHDD